MSLYGKTLTMICQHRNLFIRLVYKSLILNLRFETNEILLSDIISKPVYRIAIIAAAQCTAPVSNLVLTTKKLNVQVLIFF